ncbi:MAG: glutamate--tRNA ligase [Acidimicrobiia bacterium]|jgi:glutamyl-tRNA synthetase
MTVRVRIAPSPTGYLHVGTARAALFNWLFARHHGGTFIVRIDDTDRERSTAAFERDILGSLRWLGLDWDEGVEVGGPHGTYRQSDRFDRYREVAERLVEAGAAYHDDRTPEHLDELRARAQGEARHPGYYIRRLDPPVWSGPVRLAVPPDGPVVFGDVVRGEVRFEPDSIDDFVILRSDGTPTYHLASTVDDVDYAITHVARGEDLLPSTPKHILLSRAMGAEPPTYAHLPLLFGTDGKKLSKRYAATAVSEYRDAGYLEEALFNFLSLLGWSLGPEHTIFSRAEAVAAFDLPQVSKNPAVFDPDKLEWMNGEYVRALAPDEFTIRARPFLERGLGRALSDDDWAGFEVIAPLVQERTRLLSEVAGQVRFLYETPEYDEDSWTKVMEVEGVGAVLAAAVESLQGVGDWSSTSIEAALRGMLEDLGVGARKGLQPIRVAVTGSSISPPLFESLAVLGRAHTLERLTLARGRLG